VQQSLCAPCRIVSPENRRAETSRAPGLTYQFREALPRARGTGVDLALPIPPVPIANEPDSAPARRLARHRELLSRFARFLPPRREPLPDSPCIAAARPVLLHHRNPGNMRRRMRLPGLFVPKMLSP